MWLGSLLMLALAGHVEIDVDKELRAIEERIKALEAPWQLSSHHVVEGESLGVFSKRLGESLHTIVNWHLLHGRFKIQVNAIVAREAVDEISKIFNRRLHLRLAALRQGPVGALAMQKVSLQTRTILAEAERVQPC